MPQVRTLIGTGGEYPATWAGIDAALRAGHRWLVFTDANVTLGAGVNLDDYGGNDFLRLQGAAGGTTIQRTGDYSLFSSRATTFFGLWHVFFTGLTFDGGGLGSTDPVVEITNTDRAHFEDCTWTRGGADGLVLGRAGEGVPNTGDADVCGSQENYQAAASLFLRCNFTNNAGVGLRLLNAISFEIVDGSASGNGGGGIYWQGPPPTDCTGATRWAKGIGSIYNVDVLGSGGYAVELDRAEVIRIARCAFESNVRLGLDTRWCLVEDNKFHVGSAIEDAGYQNVARNNNFYPD